MVADTHHSRLCPITSTRPPAVLPTEVSSAGAAFAVSRLSIPRPRSANNHLRTTFRDRDETGQALETGLERSDPAPISSLIAAAKSGLVEASPRHTVPLVPRRSESVSARVWLSVPRNHRCCDKGSDDDEDSMTAMKAR